MPTDADLIQITNAALADSYARAADWMACEPGCHQCCIGVFPITTLDATRLRDALSNAPPELASNIQQRAAESRARLTPNFPGNATTGEIFTEPHHEDAFEDFANDECCPVLDPATRTCDLYAARPIPCRTFGPPMPNASSEEAEGGLAVCELCFVDAPETEVARCAVDAHFLDVETEAVAEHENHTQTHGLTLIAFALTNGQA